MSLASGDLAIAICQRCWIQYPYQELRNDPNSPGLRVCEECCDLYDPWRLAPPGPDPLVMKYPRPDTPLVVPDDAISLEAQENAETP